jgi:hypothetical protein
MSYEASIAAVREISEGRTKLPTVRTIPVIDLNRPVPRAAEAWEDRHQPRITNQPARRRADAPADPDQAPHSRAKREEVDALFAAWRTQIGDRGFTAIEFGGWGAAHGAHWTHPRNCAAMLLQGNPEIVERINPGQRPVTWRFK